MRKFTVVERKGNKIILPEEMSLKMARVALKQIEDDEETPVAINEVYDAYPTEGAFAFAQALDAEFGFYRQVGIPGMFGSEPPQMHNIPVSATEMTEVPWGRIEIPGVTGFVSTGFAFTENRVKFTITGKVLKKHSSKVQALCEATRGLIERESIYRGKAINVAFPNLSSKEARESFDPMHDVPRFIDTKGISEKDLILPEDVAKQVATGLWGPIMYLEATRRSGVPFKRGICLEGTYGVGKSLTARVTAKVCEDNNVTFIHLKQAKDLPTAIDFAKAYQPAVIFAEDIDRVTGGTRDEAMDELLNTIDGVGAKGTEIMVVLTTNHVDMIHEAMLRPGRLDQVIHIAPPDAAAVEALVRLFANKLIDQGESLVRFGELLAGEIPAVVRECVERAKLASIVRTQGRSVRASINEEDLLVAGAGLLAQRHALRREPATSASMLDALGNKIGEGLGKVLKTELSESGLRRASHQLQLRGKE